MNVDLSQVSGTFLAVISVLAATLSAIWISLTIWAFRDMRTRTRDTVSQVLAALVVLLLNIPGFLVYLILRPRETLSEQYQRALEEETLLQEIENKQVCPGCSQPTRDSWRICPFCHTKLRRLCSNCNQLLELDWQICPYCETPQVAGQGPSRGVQIEQKGSNEPLN